MLWRSIVAGGASGRPRSCQCLTGDIVAGGASGRPRSCRCLAGDVLHFWWCLRGTLVLLVPHGSCSASPLRRTAPRTCFGFIWTRRARGHQPSVQLEFKAGFHASLIQGGMKLTWNWFSVRKIPPPSKAWVLRTRAILFSPCSARAPRCSTEKCARSHP